MENSGFLVIIIQDDFWVILSVRDLSPVNPILNWIYFSGGTCSSCSDDQTFTSGTQSGSVYLTSSGATTGPTLPV